MKKVISFCLIIIMSLTFFGCGKDKNSLDVIDFETGTLNIDASKIEEYVHKNGYDNYIFDFDVDKSIYSCEVYLTEDASQNVNIDGEGYESFIASARNFLTKGTEVMATVLNEYDLSGISAGMVLASDEGVVYCVAIDGTVSYVAHVKSNTLTVSDLEKNIAEVANEILNDKLTVTINNPKKVISVFYEGEANGGSKQTQESVQNAFAAIKDYLKEIDLNGYAVSVNSYDGFPYMRDALQSDASSETDIVQTPNIPNGLAAKYLDTSNTNYAIFELVATPEGAENAANDAISEVRNTLEHDRFAIYVVDNALKLLGRCTPNGYEPYEFQESYDPFKTPPYLHPFNYGLYKYFGSIETISFKHEDEITEGGGRMYMFDINVSDEANRDECQKAADSLVHLMNHNIGEDKEVVVTVHIGTSNEIRSETSNND